MEQALVVISLGLFLVLLLAFLAVLQRASRVVADTREEDTFRRDGAILADRSSLAITDAAQAIDRVRRRQDAPDSLDEILPATMEALQVRRTDVEALTAPAPLVGLRDRLAGEIERAGRALEMVQHGCSLLGVTAGRPRELEGETSIKRGYLNLLHAREALLSLGVDLRSGRVDASRWFSDRARFD